MSYGMYWSEPVSVKQSIVEAFIKELGAELHEVAYVEIRPTMVYLYKYQYNADGTVKIGVMEPNVTEHCYSIREET